MLIIGIVGTTVAPWQLFFQQSYVVDKRINPASSAMRASTFGVGIALVIVGGGALMAFTAAAFEGKPEFGNFTDAGGIAAGIGKYVGRRGGYVRDRPDRRGSDRRLGGVALDRLRDRRCVSGAIRCIARSRTLRVSTPSIAG